MLRFLFEFSDKKKTKQKTTVTTIFCVILLNLSQLTFVKVHSGPNSEL